ncbi:MAG: nitroreductase family protein [Sulfolobales archaeon]
MGWGWSTNHEGILTTILSRSSIRWFKQDEVSDHIINKILECGIRAPNAGGSEPWFFIVVKNYELRIKIHKLLLEAHKLYATSALKEPLPQDKIDKWLKKIEEGMYYAPIYIAVYADLKRATHREELIHMERTYITQSVAAAIENILLAAHALGIGAVWLGVPLLIQEKFNKLLNPPEKCELQAIIALGYPAETPKTRPRRPINEVVKYIN